MLYDSIPLRDHCSQYQAASLLIALFPASDLRFKWRGWTHWPIELSANLKKRLQTKLKDGTINSTWRRGYKLNLKKRLQRNNQPLSWNVVPTVMIPVPRISLTFDWSCSLKLSFQALRRSQRKCHKGDWKWRLTWSWMLNCLLFHWQEFLPCLKPFPSRTVSLSTTNDSGQCVNGKRPSWLHHIVFFSVANDQWTQHKWF